MANYKNSLGESELFGRMTVGFTKVCESVQSGRFVRNEMGVICESCNGSDYDEDTHTKFPGEVTGKVEEDDGVTDAGTEGATQDADVASATPEQINGSTQNVNEGAGAGYTITIKDLKLAEITEVTKVSDGYDFTAKIAPGEYEVTADSYYDRYFPLGEYDDALIKIDGGTIRGNVGYIPSEVDDGDDEVRDYVKYTVCRNPCTVSTMYGCGWIHQYLPEDGKIMFGDVDLMDDLYFTVYDMFIDSKNMSEMINYGSVHCNDEDDVEESCGRNKKPRKVLKECDFRKKPLKKLIPEGCCGGKARKVLKECGSAVVTEKKVPLCKTCGNPIDETGTCRDCQGYSEVKEVDGEIKLQVPADIRRRALLKNGAKDNQRKLACAIRDRKATGIIKEDANGKKEDQVVAKARRILGFVDEMRAGIRKGHGAKSMCDTYLPRIEDMTTSLLSSYSNVKK